MQGKLIVLEGLNGCGKSSAASVLDRIMRENDRKVRLYRDPGDTPIGEAIRKLVKDPAVEMEPIAQCLMYTAARVQLAKYMEPWLKEGGNVVLDRWWPSTYAYQGAGGVPKSFIRSISRSLVNEVCEHGLCDTTPSLTFFIDAPIPVCMERAGTLVRDADPESGGDRFEQKGCEFQQDLLNLYSELCNLGEMTHVNALSFKSAEDTAVHLWDNYVKGMVP